MIKYKDPKNYRKRWTKVTRQGRLKEQGREFYCNPAEDQLAVFLHGQGVESTKRGYPDFTVYNSDGSIYGFVEVKSTEEKMLKSSQSKFSQFMFKLNVPFLKWCPSDGTETLENFLKGRY